MVGILAPNAGHRSQVVPRRRRTASKYAYPPTRCIENPLFRPADPQLSSTGVSIQDRRHA